MSNHGAMNTFTKPLVEQSRSTFRGSNHESNHTAITTITFSAKPLIEQSRSNEHPITRQAITNPPPSLEGGFGCPGRRVSPKQDGPVPCRRPDPNDLLRGDNQ